MFDRFRKKKSLTKQTDTPPDHTVVPPESSVTVIYPQSEAHVVQLESGYWLADFGAEAVNEIEILTEVEKILQTEAKSAVILVIQKAIIEAWTTDLSRLISWLRHLYQVDQQRNPQSRGGTIVAIPPLARHSQGLMALLKSLSFGVHYFGQDGTICIEVHQPDGTIVLGMTGPNFDYPIESLLFDLYERRRAVVDNRIVLAEIQKEEWAFVEKMMHLYDPLTLADLVTRCADEGTPENLKAICEGVPYTVLGTWLPKEHSEIRTEDQTNLRAYFPTTTVPNFGPALITYCNIPEMRKLYPNDTIFPVKALDLLNIARQKNYGVIISNGTDGRDSWVLLSPANIVDILRQYLPDPV